MAEFKFTSNATVITCGVHTHMGDNAPFVTHVHECIARHFSGDWGDMDAEDKATNDAGLEGGGRLMSAYKAEGHPKIWIITEWDRSVTTVLFPDEY